MDEGAQWDTAGLINDLPPQRLPVDRPPSPGLLSSINGARFSGKDATLIRRCTHETICTMRNLPNTAHSFERRANRRQQRDVAGDVDGGDAFDGVHASHADSETTRRVKYRSPQLRLVRPADGAGGLQGTGRRSTPPRPGRGTCCRGGEMEGRGLDVEGRGDRDHVDRAPQRGRVNHNSFKIIPSGQRLPSSSNMAMARPPKSCDGT